jgi:hypothetical protein
MPARRFWLRGGSGGSGLGGSASYVSFTGDGIQLPEPESQEPGQACNCTNRSAGIDFMEADDVSVNITIRKLDDCNTRYVLLVTDPGMVLEKEFWLSERGDEALFTNQPRNPDWVEMKARLYCRDTYLAGRIDDYMDMKILKRDLSETNQIIEQNPIDSPTGAVIGADSSLWWLGLLLMLAFLFILAYRRKKQDKSSISG